MTRAFLYKREWGSGRKAKDGKGTTSVVPYDPTAYSGFTGCGKTHDSYQVIPSGIT
jgi:hypothetical protein